MITFTVTVTDSAGQPQTLVAQYPTRGIWYGDLSGTISSAGPSFNCAGTFNGPIRVVVASSNTASGPVDVTGDGAGARHRFRLRVSAEFSADRQRHVHRSGHL